MENDEDLPIVVDDDTDADFEAGFKAQRDPFEAPKPRAASEPATEVDATAQAQDGGQAPPGTEPAPEPDPDATEPDAGDGSDEGESHVKTTKGKSEIEELRTRFAQLEGALQQSAHATKSDLGRVQAHLQKLVELQQVQRTQPAASPPAVEARRIEASMMSELAEGYPELTEHLLPGLARVLAANTAAIDPLSVQRMVTEAIETAKPTIIGEASARAKTEAAFDAINEEHGNWEAVVGVKDSDGSLQRTPDGRVVASEEFRTWFSTKPAEFREKFDNTKSPVFVSNALSEFKKFAATKMAADTARQTRLQRAVTPSGKPGVPGPTQLSDEQEFLRGFKEAR